MIDQRNQKITIGRAMKDFVKGSFDFKGYTSRAGYWKFILAFIPIIIILILWLSKDFASIMFQIMKERGYFDALKQGMVVNTHIPLEEIIVRLPKYYLLFIPVFIWHYIAVLAIVVRRYRDVGFNNKALWIFVGGRTIFRIITNYFVSGVIFFGIINFIISIIELVLLCLKSNSLCGKQGIWKSFVRAERSDISD